MEFSMNKSKMVVIKGILSIIILSVIGVAGCFLIHKLNIFFLEGIPFPLIVLILAGIIIEVIGLLLTLYTQKNYPMYVFGSIIIIIYLFLFIVAVINYFFQAPGGNNTGEWLPVIFLSYLGICIQIYFLYKVNKIKENPQ
jgi:hypothetical protein